MKKRELFFIILDIFRSCHIFIVEGNMRGRLSHRASQNRKTPLKHMEKTIIFTPKWQQDVLDLMRRMGDLK